MLIIKSNDMDHSKEKSAWITFIDTHSHYEAVFCNSWADLNKVVCVLCELSHFSHAQVFLTAWTVAPRPLCPRESPGKNTGVGCHALLQGIFPTQGLNLHLLCLLHCGRMLCSLSHLGLIWKWDLNPCAYGPEISRR